jgi:pimeloyl-ACP methyl ester carboxylesterase
MVFINIFQARVEAERARPSTIRSILYSASGDVSDRDREAAGGSLSMVPRSGGFLTRMINPTSLPPWLSEADVDFYAAEFMRTGFHGGLNWYRNIDRNWELLAPFSGARVSVPALYVAGERDLVVGFPGMDQLIAKLPKFVPQLQGTIMLPGCGHWTQQERPRR